MDIISQIRKIIDREKSTPGQKKALLSVLNLWAHRGQNPEKSLAYRDEAMRNQTVLKDALEKRNQIQYFFTLALTFMELQDYENAAVLFQRIAGSYRLPGYLDIRDFHRGFPVGYASFASMTPQLWEVFRSKEDALQKAYDSQSYTGLAGLLDDIFRPILPNLAFAYGKGGNTYLLQFGLLDSPESIFPLLYLIEHAPTDLRLPWRFNAGLTKMTHMKVNISGKQYGLSNFEYTKGVKNDDGNIPLEVYTAPLSKLAKSDKAKAEQLAKEAVCYAIGELPALSFYDPITVSKFSPRYSNTLDTLWASHTSTSTGDLTARRYLLNCYVGRLQRFNPSKGLRSDILDGTSCFPKMLRQYQSNSAAAYSTLAKYGVAAGFVFYPKELCKETDLDRYFHDLDWRIAELADSEIYITGYAYGSRYHYIDFVAYDFLKVMNALKQVFSSMEGGNAARFASFYPGTEPTSLDAETVIAAYRRKMSR